ncbi:hypothetical protein ACFFRR_004285 [Megaselia abdita]
MNNAIAFLIFGVFAITTFVDAQLPNNMYYLVNHTISQNNVRIRYSEIKLNVTDNRFDHFIETVRHNNEMVERTISEYTSDITVLGFLNKTIQNCVIKYAIIPDVTKTKLAINTCANKANIAFFGELPRNQIAYMKNYNMNIYYGTQTCFANNKYNSQKLTDCINARIDENNLLIDTALKTVDRQFQSALELYDLISRDASECVYAVELDLGRTIKNNQDTIRLCRLGLLN